MKQPTPSSDLLLQNLLSIALEFVPVMVIGTAANVLTGWIRHVGYVANIEKIPYQFDQEFRACIILNPITTSMMNVHVDQQPPEGRTGRGSFIRPAHYLTRRVPVFIFLANCRDRSDESVDDGILEVAILDLLAKDKAINQNPQLRVGPFPFSPKVDGKKSSCYIPTGYTSLRQRRYHPIERFGAFGLPPVLL